MSGIIAAESESDKGVAQLRNTILHTFVNSGNAQLFGNLPMKTVLDVWDAPRRSHRLIRFAQYKWDMYAKRLFLKFALARMC